jgi:hypothetical protein
MHGNRAAAPHLACSFVASLASLVRSSSFSQSLELKMVQLTGFSISLMSFPETCQIMKNNVNLQGNQKPLVEKIKTKTEEASSRNIT